MPSPRLIVALSVCTAAGLLALVAPLAPSATERLAQGLVGQRSYAVEQQGQGVGYLRSRTEQAPDGTWVLAQQLHINLLNAPALSTSQTLTFAGREPHHLLHAQYREDRQDHRQQIILRRDNDSYSAKIERNGDTEIVHSDIVFTLSDQLGLEHQLSQQAVVGATYTWDYLDLQQLDVSQRQQLLRAYDGLSYTLTTPANGNVTTLDNQLRLVAFDAPYQFSFALTSMADSDLHQLTEPLSLQWSKRLAVVPLTRPLTKPQTLSSLTLAVATTAEQTVEDQGLPATLTHGAVTADAPAAGAQYLQGSLALPVGHPSILQELPQDPITDASSAAELAQRLIDQTRGHLLYSANQPAGSVLAALATGRGECVDFADLLTTLARTQGIASRTVYGIAYSPLPEPGFRFHAWNEIWYDQGWHALDPTWDQSSADATHIAMNDQTMAAMASAMQRQSITLTPTAWGYSSAD